MLALSMQTAYSQAQDAATPASPPPAQTAPAAQYNYNYSVGEVVKLSKSGVNESVVLAYINGAAAYYSLTANDILALKNDGISSPVLAATLTHDSTLQKQQPAASPAPASQVAPPVASQIAPQVAPQQPAPLPVAQVAPPSPVVIAQPPMPAPQVEVVTVCPGPGYYWDDGYWTWGIGGWVWCGGGWHVHVGGPGLWIGGRWHEGGAMSAAAGTAAVIAAKSLSKVSYPTQGVALG